MNLYEAVLFDFDGVIADSEPLHYACWAEALAPLGITFDWKTYSKHLIGLADPELLGFLSRLPNPPVPIERLWDQYPRKQEIFRQRALENPPIPEETVRLLKSLTDYKLGLVTSTGRAEVEPVLERAGIRDCFGALVYSEDVTRHKPAPEPYLLAARRLGVTRALVVEDSEAGIAAGRAAGFDVVRIRDAGKMAEVVMAKLRDSRSGQVPITDIM